MLKDLTVEQYINILAGKAPTPGGGSSLAVIVANALALCEMSLNVTSNKLKKQNLDTSDIDKQADCFAQLRQTAISVIDDDKTAFDNIINAMRMPKDTPTQKAQRTQKLQDCYLKSAKVCLTLMQTACKGFLLADTAIACSDKFVVSDAIIGKALLNTATKCCQHNVDVNVDCLTDEAVKSELQAQRNEYLNKVCDIKV